MSEPIPGPEPEFAAFIGIDWADREHVWALQEASRTEREKGTLENTPEAIEAWALQLGARFAGRPVAIALEQSRGALVYMLSKYQHVVLYPIHPGTSHSYRTAMFPSGSKDDPRDSDLLLELVTLHRGRLRALQPDTEPTRKLQALVEKRRQLVDEQTAQTNRITELLKLYFPQVLGWFEELGSPIVAAFLQRWPTVDQLHKEDAETLRTFFRQHHSGSKERIQQRLEQIRQAVAATRDAAVVEPAVIMVDSLLSVVAALRAGIAALEGAIEAVAAAHPDYSIFASFPAAAKVMAPRLLAAFGSQRERYGSASEMQSFSGIAPVISRSGNRKWTHFRWACPKFLRQTFHEYAGLSIQRCAWAKDFYRQQRSRGKGHHAAVRSLAFKWIRILFRCWKSRTPYDEQLFLRSRSGPPAATPSHPGDGPQPASVASLPASGESIPQPASVACGSTLEFHFKNTCGFAQFDGLTS